MSANNGHHCRRAKGPPTAVSGAGPSEESVGAKHVARCGIAKPMRLLRLFIGRELPRGGDKLLNGSPILIGKVLDAQTSGLVELVFSQAGCNGADLRSPGFHPGLGFPRNVHTSSSQQAAAEVRRFIARTGQIGEDGDNALFAL